MASSSPADADLGSETSAAQKLLQKHQVTVEEVADEEDLKHDAALAAEAAEASADTPATNGAAAPTWGATPSAKAAGKQKAADPVPSAKIDTQSHELFPELAGPKKTVPHVAPVWGAKAGATTNGNGIASNGDSRAPAASSPVPTPASTVAPAPISIPGRNVKSVTFEESELLPRGALKKPIADIIKDINRKSRANVTMAAPIGSKRRFDANGPPDVSEQALRELAQQIGQKVTRPVPIPQSTRPFIIGKQGATIKSLQEKTGARIQVPKAEEVAQSALADDDDALINVMVEGNVLAVNLARDAIMKIVGERTSNMKIHVHDIPAEFYPFIADPRNELLANLASNNVNIRVPTLQPWSAQPPVAPTAAGARPVFAPAPAENLIQLSGDLGAIQNARTEIEQYVEGLRQRLELQQTTIPKGRQQFIIGSHGTPMEDFFNETGCTIILPTDEEDDTVTIIGPADQLNAGLDRAIDLAMGMQCSNYDIARFHRQAAGSAAAHARNVTRYLRERKEIERLESEYQAHINTPFTAEGALPWELYSRDGKNAFRAQSEIKNIVSSHPPSRMATVPVDPFFYQFLRNDVRPRLQREKGIYLVVPDAASEPGVPILLVYEGPSSADASNPYTVPQTVPAASEAAAFQKAIAEAQKHILDLIGAQESIQTIAVDVPLKFHDRLRKFIKQQQENRPPNQPPIRVSSLGTTVTLRGPKTPVESLAAKVNEFVELAKEDEKERGFSLVFDYPKEFTNHLIGKGGSHIAELREKFDVWIQVLDGGKVEVTGPKAKAEAAKAHISSMARHLADEVNYTLKLEPKFHRELIGAQGSNITRLQERHKVHINFPRIAKPAKDDDSATDAASDAGKTRRQQAPDEVSIRGPKKGADEARDELQTLYQYLKDNSFTGSISVLQKQVPLLIGQGGANMDKLRQTTGAKIDVPNSRGDPESTVEIQVKGTKTQVAAALKELQSTKLALDDTVIKTIEVEKKYHKALIGTGGANLRELVSKAGGGDDRKDLMRMIQFPSQDSTDNVIKVEGRKAIVDNILAQIEAFVNERASQVSKSIDVPREKHRILIGRGGDTRRNIESQFSVTLDIPRQGDDRTEIKATGLPANVEKAIEHIQSLIREQHSETVQVPRRVHHAISNQGQFFRRMRSDYKVTVDHAGQTPPARPAAPATNGSASLPLITDDEETAADAHSWKVVDDVSTEEGEIPWVLHGTPENVEKAKNVLLKALESQGEGSATGYLMLPDPSVFRYIVGHAGKKIESIRKQSGCRIQVPQGRAGGQPVEIVGSKDGVEVAKDLILAAVKEGANKRQE